MSKVKSVEIAEEEEFVFDAICEAPHSYLTNGLVSHNCILWVDEIEKGIAGVRSSGMTDSGTTARLFSTFLTWMQEKKAPVFLIATANNVNDIPPEFMRAGRFDEVFFADLPNRTERFDIWKALLRRKKRDPNLFHLTRLTNQSEGYTGAEIEKAIDLALFDGYEENREITTDDVATCLTRFMPISKAQPDAVAAMRAWAAERCVRANTPETTPGSAIDRQKDIDL
jgi:SpoVK/Ycf46/Vps4 family AAA+-type ATPase